MAEGDAPGARTQSRLFERLICPCPHRKLGEPEQLQPSIETRHISPMPEFWGISPHEGFRLGDGARAGKLQPINSIRQYAAAKCKEENGPGDPSSQQQPVKSLPVRCLDRLQKLLRLGGLEDCRRCDFWRKILSELLSGLKPFLRRFS